MGPEIWLKEMLRRELDLRPPSLAKINENSIIIKDNNNHPIAYAIRSNRWAGFEINSFVIDPAHRGKGLSHKLLEKCRNGRLFAYTRDIRLQSTLGKAGFERRATPGLLALFSIFISRLALVFWMVITLDFRRLLHQMKYLPKYKLYIREL